MSGSIMQQRTTNQRLESMLTELKFIQLILVDQEEIIKIILKHLLVNIDLRVQVVSRQTNILEENSMTSECGIVP